MSVVNSECRHVQLYVTLTIEDSELGSMVNYPGQAHLQRQIFRAFKGYLLYSNAPVASRHHLARLSTPFV